MKELSLSVLIIESVAAYANAVRTLLASSELDAELEVAETLSTGLDRIRGQRYDVLLLDLFLSDSAGLETLHAISHQAAGTPVVILTSRRHQAIALQAVRAGAQDFLPREGMRKEMLVRAIRFAVERHRLLEELRVASLKDELTGLYNRRGFVMLGEQQIRLALRNSTPMSVIFADLDGMKRINDRFGHPAGDEALRQMAEVMRRTFRACDVLARLGGDEFVALALEAGAIGGPVIRDRLLRNLAESNSTVGRPFQLSASTGLEVFEPGAPLSLDLLLAKADAAMYAQKRARLRQPDGRVRTRA